MHVCVAKQLTGSISHVKRFSYMLLPLGPTFISIYLSISGLTNHEIVMFTFFAVD